MNKPPGGISTSGPSMSDSVGMALVEEATAVQKRR